MVTVTIKSSKLGRFSDYVMMTIEVGAVIYKRVIYLESEFFNALQNESEHAELDACNDDSLSLSADFKSNSIILDGGDSLDEFAFHFSPEEMKSFREQTLAQWRLARLKENSTREVGSPISSYESE